MNHEDEEEHHDHCRTLFCSSFPWKVDFSHWTGITGFVHFEDDTAMGNHRKPTMNEDVRIQT